MNKLVLLFVLFSSVAFGSEQTLQQYKDTVHKSKHDYQVAVYLAVDVVAGFRACANDLFQLLQRNIESANTEANDADGKKVLKDSVEKTVRDAEKTAPNSECVEEIQKFGIAADEGIDRDGPKIIETTQFVLKTFEAEGKRLHQDAQELQNQELQKTQQDGQSPQI